MNLGCCPPVNTGKKVVWSLKSTDPAFHFPHWGKHGSGSWEQSPRQRKLLVFCWYPWGDADFHCMAELHSGSLCSASGDPPALKGLQERKASLEKSAEPSWLWSSGGCPQRALGRAGGRAEQFFGLGWCCGLQGFPHPLAQILIKLAADLWPRKISCSRPTGEHLLSTLLPLLSLLLPSVTKTCLINKLSLITAPEQPSTLPTGALRGAPSQGFFQTIKHTL